MKVNDFPNPGHIERDAVPATSDPVAIYLDALSPGSRRTLRQSLTVVAKMLNGGRDVEPTAFDWSQVDQTAVTRLRNKLTKQYAPATANKMLAALRGVLRVCRDQGRITEAQFQAALRFDAVEQARASNERVLSEAELKRLFHGCTEDGTAAGRRDAAMLAIFLCCGLRREEVSQLDVDDYDAGQQTLHVRSDRLDRDRVVELDTEACAAIDHWLGARGRKSGPLLMPVNRGGAIRMRRLTAQAVYNIVIRCAGRAGLAHTTSRDLRRTCIVRLIRCGLDLEQIRRRLGQLSWLTASVYQSLASQAGKLGTTKLPIALQTESGS